MKKSYTWMSVDKYNIASIVTYYESTSDYKTQPFYPKDIFCYYKKYGNDKRQY